MENGMTPLIAGDRPDLAALIGADGARAVYFGRWAGLEARCGRHKCGVRIEPTEGAALAAVPTLREWMIKPKGYHG